MAAIMLTSSWESFVAGFLHEAHQSKSILVMMGVTTIVSFRVHPLKVCLKPQNSY